MIKKENIDVKAIERVLKKRRLAREKRIALWAKSAPDGTERKRSVKDAP